MSEAEKPEYNFNVFHDGEDTIEEKLKHNQENLCEYMNKCKIHYHKQCTKYLDSYEQCDVYQFFKEWLK